MTKLIKASGPSRRGIVKAAGALVAGIAAPALLRVRSAYAAYPDRTVKFVVANTPGGPSDIVGRFVTAALEQSTGKTFIVDNRGGAGGNIGMEYVAHAEPDGYTILLATNAYSVNYGLYNQLPWRPLQGFRRGERACDIAEHVCGQVGTVGEVHEGFHRARPRQSRAIQLRDVHRSALTAVPAGFR